MAVRIQFVMGGSVSSRMIGWFGGGSAFSHVDNVLPDGTLLGARSDSVGGQAPGVRVRPKGYANWSKRVMFEIDCADQQALIWKTFLLAQVGKPYDRDLIFGLGLGNNFGAPRDWREVDSWICSELTMRALEIAAIVPPLYLSAAKIIPNTAAMIASAIGGRIVEQFPAETVPANTEVAGADSKDALMTKR